MILAALAVALSTSALLFVAVQGAKQTEPHHSVPSAQMRQQANRGRPAHGPTWLFRATDWVVLVASKGLT